MHKIYCCVPACLRAHNLSCLKATPMKRRLRLQTVTLYAALFPAIANTYDLSGRQISMLPKEITGLLHAVNRETSGITPPATTYIICRSRTRLMPRICNLRKMSYATIIRIWQKSKCVLMDIQTSSQIIRDFEATDDSQINMWNMRQPTPCFCSQNIRWRMLMRDIHEKCGHQRVNNTLSKLHGTTGSERESNC